MKNDVRPRSLRKQISTDAELGMNAIVQFVVRNGYLILFATAFAHQIGLPVPGPLFLLAAGALAAAGKLGFVPAVALCVVASVLADWVWYEAGRRRGDKVLHFLHGFTRDPDAHDRRAKRTFARYGLQLLLVAKFIPGLDAVSPPLAGISRTSRFRFLMFDVIGAGAYSCTYAGLGYIFRHDLDRAATYVGRAGTFLAIVAVSAIILFSGYKLVRRRNRPMRESQSAFGSMNEDDGIPRKYEIGEGLGYGD